MKLLLPPPDASSSSISLAPPSSDSSSPSSPSSSSSSSSITIVSTSSSSFPFPFPLPFTPLPAPAEVTAPWSCSRTLTDFGNCPKSVLNTSRYAMSCLPFSIGRGPVVVVVVAVPAATNRPFANSTMLAKSATVCSVRSCCPEEVPVLLLFRVASKSHNGKSEEPEPEENC